MAVIGAIGHLKGIRFLNIHVREGTHGTVNIDPMFFTLEKFFKLFVGKGYANFTE